MLAARTPPESVQGAPVDVELLVLVVAPVPLVLGAPVEPVPASVDDVPDAEQP